MKISLQLATLPMSTNNMYAHMGRHRFLTTKARENKESIAREARLQYRGKPLECPLAVDICLWWPNARNHDVDNVKGLLDALTGVLWEDDGLIVDLRVRKGIDRANPRVVLELSTGSPLE